MEAVCFSPASLALLGSIWLLLQGVIVTLFWLAIRAKEDSIKDAREIRDRALEINEQALSVGERQNDLVERALPKRGRR